MNDLLFFYDRILLQKEKKMNTARSVCIKWSARVNLFLNVNGINENSFIQLLLLIRQ